MKSHDHESREEVKWLKNGRSSEAKEQPQMIHIEPANHDHFQCQ